MLSFSSHLIQPVLSLLNHFNGVSFECALTHRSFPRILPDSSYSPRVSLKFFPKFDVRMNYHQSNAFSKICQILFIIGSTFSIFHSGVHQRFMVVFLVVILRFRSRRRVSLKSSSILFKIRDSSLFPSSHNCSIVRILFIHPEQFRSLFSLFIRSPPSKIYSFSAFSYHSPNFTGASCK